MTTATMTDEQAIDAIATVLGTSAAWGADHLDTIATLIAAVRPHPGDRSPLEYAADFTANTGRGLATDWADQHYWDALAEAQQPDPDTDNDSEVREMNTRAPDDRVTNTARGVEDPPSLEVMLGQLAQRVPAAERELMMWAKVHAVLAGDPDRATANRGARA